MQAKTFFPTPLPNLLKELLALTLAGSLFSHFLIPYLSLAHVASGNFHLFQLITYPFISLLPSELLSLLFNLYILWVFGISLIERMHALFFSILFFGATLTGGLFALATMSFFPHSLFFFGGTPVIYGLLTSWVMLNKETHILLFFTLPLKAANLLLLLIGFSLVMDLSSGDFTHLFASLGAILFSYFFTLLSCRAKSLFSFLSPFVNKILQLLEKAKHWRSKGETSHTKIYDIKSGKAVLNDDEFMDAMLSRISLYGEGSLSPK